MMSSYDPTRLTPGMMVKTTKGVCTIVKRLADRQHPKGWMMARYKTTGEQKTFTTPFGFSVEVIAVPAKCECTSVDYCESCLKRMSKT